MSVRIENPGTTFKFGMTKVRGRKAEFIGTLAACLMMILMGVLALALLLNRVPA